MKMPAHQLASVGERDFIHGTHLVQSSNSVAPQGRKTVVFSQLRTTAQRLSQSPAVPVMYFTWDDAWMREIKVAPSSDSSEKKILQRKKITAF
jgi:hypothetical protein